MASTTGVSAQIYALRTVSGNQPVMRRLAEKSGQTFQAGVPVQLSGGYVQEWDGVVANGLVGVAKESGSNLAASGVAQTLTFGSVPNESSAVNIPRGAPLNDGRNGVEIGAQDSVFFAQVGTTTAVTDVGVAYGITKDTDGHWYVDKAKTGVNAVCKVVKLDPVDTSRGVHIVFLSTVVQMPA